MADGQQPEKAKKRALLTVVTLAATVIAGIAAFSGNLLSIGDNTRKLFGWSLPEVTVRSASMTYVPTNDSYYQSHGEIEFVAEVKNMGPLDEVECYGMAADDKSTYRSQTLNQRTVALGLGLQSKALTIHGYSEPPTHANFRLACRPKKRFEDARGPMTIVSPWVAMDVKTPPQNEKPRK